MSYCIAIHSDIETLKMVRDRLIAEGYKNDEDWNQYYLGDMTEEESHYLYIVGDKLAFHNHDAGANEVFTTTPSTLHETIDLVIKKLKEHENNNE